MPQTSVSLFHGQAFAGMLADGGDSTIFSHTALALVLAGAVVEIDPATGDVQTFASGSVFGVAIYKDSVTPGGYGTGKTVPVLRRGDVWLNDAAVTAIGLAHPLLPLHSTIVAHGTDAVSGLAISLVAVDMI